MAKLKRKLRGMETAQAVLLLVIAVAIAIALWLVVSGMMASANAPQIQYDPSASYASGSNTYIAVKVGTTVNSVTGNAATLNGEGLSTPVSCSIAWTSAGAGATFPVMPGQEIVFQCPITLGPGFYVLTFTYNQGQQAAIKFYWAGG